MYHLIPSGVAFAGMVVVTAFNAFIAWRQSAELLAVYAIVGAFSTPLLLSTGRNEEVFLFSYLLMMNAATMALLVLKGWNRLLALSFLGTVAFYWGWYWQFYAPAAFVTTTVFLSFFILLFAAATILARHRRVHPEQDDTARALVSMANAAFGFLGFYAMLSHNGSGRNTALAWCSVGFGAFYLGVRKWMERTPIAGSRLASLSDVQLSIAIVFLTLAVPLAVHGHWVTVGWMAEGAVLVWVATRVGSRLMQFLAVGALALGLISLSMDATIAQTRVLWNTRFLSFAVSVAAMAVATVLARGAANREPATNSGSQLGTARADRRGGRERAGHHRCARGDSHILVVRSAAGGRCRRPSDTRFIVKQRHMADGRERSPDVGCIAGQADGSRVHPPTGREHLLGGWPRSSCSASGWSIRSSRSSGTCASSPLLLRLLRPCGPRVIRRRRVLPVARRFTSPQAYWPPFSY